MLWEEEGVGFTQLVLLLLLTDPSFSEAFLLQVEKGDNPFRQQGSFLPTGVRSPISCKLEEGLYSVHSVFSMK